MSLPEDFVSDLFTCIDLALRDTVTEEVRIAFWQRCHVHLNARLKPVKVDKEATKDDIEN